MNVHERGKIEVVVGSKLRYWFVNVAFSSLVGVKKRLTEFSGQVLPVPARSKAWAASMHSKFTFIRRAADIVHVHICRCHLGHSKTAGESHPEKKKKKTKR